MLAQLVFAGMTFFLLARLFFADATFFAGTTFFLLARLFFAGTNFLLELLCTLLLDLLRAQTMNMCS